MQAGVDLQQHDRPGPQHLILIGMLKQAVLPEAPGPGRVVQSVGFATVSTPRNFSTLWVRVTAAGLRALVSLDR